MITRGVVDGTVTKISLRQLLGVCHDLLLLRSMPSFFSSRAEKPSICRLFVPMKARGIPFATISIFATIIIAETATPLRHCPAPNRPVFSCWGICQPQIVRSFLLGHYPAQNRPFFPVCDPLSVCKDVNARTRTELARSTRDNVFAIPILVGYTKRVTGWLSC